MQRCHVSDSRCIDQRLPLSLAVHWNTVCLRIVRVIATPMLVLICIRMSRLAFAPPSDGILVMVCMCQVVPASLTSVLSVSSTSLGISTPRVCRVSLVVLVSWDDPQRCTSPSSDLHASPSRDAHPLIVSSCPFEGACVPCFFCVCSCLLYGPIRQVAAVAARCPALGMVPTRTEVCIPL